MDKNKKRFITENFEKLVEGTAFKLDKNLADLLISKLKGTESSCITYTSILQFYDLYKFIASRETNYIDVNSKTIHSYRPTMSTNFKSIQNLINFLWIKIGKDLNLSKHFR